VVAELVISRGLADGEERLRASLGLPEVTLAQFDPFEAGADRPLALQVQRASAQVAVLMQLGQRAGFAGQDLVRAIADRVLAAGGDGLNLTSPRQVLQLLRAAAPLLAAASLEDLAAGIASSNGQIAKADSLEAIARAQGRSLRGEIDAPEEPRASALPLELPTAPEPGSTPPAADLPQGSTPDVSWRKLYRKLVVRLVGHRSSRRTRRKIRQLMQSRNWSDE
jgi:hypothetical protein